MIFNIFDFNFFTLNFNLDKIASLYFISLIKKDVHNNLSIEKITCVLNFYIIVTFV